ncbi:hypothetical protein ACN47E_006417 [Coniothyrium glycines]
MIRGLVRSGSALCKPAEVTLVTKSSSEGIIGSASIFPPKKNLHIHAVPSKAPYIMPPKNIQGRRVQEPSFASSTLSAFTSAENRSVVTAVGLFAIGVTFLHSSWAEILLPA